MTDASPRASSIALSIFTLVIGAVITATAIFFVITFNGPPPKDPPRGAESIAYALQTGQQPGDPGPALQIEMRRGPPVPDDRLIVDPAGATRIAQILHTPVDRIVALAAKQPSGLGDARVGDFTVALRLSDRWRVVENTPTALFKRWHWITLGGMLATILALAAPTWLIARAISRPLRAIAHEANSARAGVPLGRMPDGGPREVQLLTQAVNRMHGRLTRYVEGRTAMLAAIAHDLGTPLSRLAFWIEQLPENARARAMADIEEMRAMLGGVLQVARDVGTQKSDARIDLGSLLDSLIEDMRVAGAPVSIVPGAKAIVRGDSQALRRLFANLIDNAIRYGQAAALSWAVDADNITVAIDDRGPGFEVTTAERLFEPFVRGDPSRNRATGGTGLGLAIVRSIAEAHGGMVALDNHPAGGRVRVLLPLAR